MNSTNTNSTSREFLTPSGQLNSTQNFDYQNQLAHEKKLAKAAIQPAVNLNLDQQENNDELRAVVSDFPPLENLDKETSPSQKIAINKKDKVKENYKITISDLLRQDNTGVPPLHNAILHKNPEFALVLLKNGASITTDIAPPNKQSHEKVNAMLYLANRNIFPTIASLHEPIVNFATQMLNVVGENAFPYIGFNALTLAISNGQNIEFIKELCVTGKQNDRLILNRMDGNGQTPLGLATKENNMAITNLLLELGADPNIKDKKGATPLDHAIKNNSEELKLALVKAGANRLLNEKSVAEYAYVTKDIALLAEYKNHSVENSDSVTGFLLNELNTIAKKSDTDFSEFLNFISPILNDDILNEFFLQTAAIPGTISKLMIIQDKFNDPFPENLMLDLRTAASISNDSDQYEFAINIDKKFVGFLKDEQNKNTLSDSKICSELSLAIAANNIEWICIFLNHNENFLHSDSRHLDKPLISQIADIQTEESLFKFIPENVVRLLLSRENFDNRKHIPFLEVNTAQGFKKLIDAAGDLINNSGKLSKYLLAEHAVKLKSTDLIDILIEKGVDLNFHSKDDYYHSLGKSLYSQALEDGNDEMVNHLILKGVDPTPSDVRRAEFMKSTFAITLERLLFSN